MSKERDSKKQIAFIQLAEPSSSAAVNRVEGLGHLLSLRIATSIIVLDKAGMRHSTGSRMAYQSRSLPYLSTLQPQFWHVHPPHQASRNEVALRAIGKGSAHRGQTAPNIPMPRLCDVFRTKYMPTISAGTVISKIHVDLSIDPSTSRHCRNVRWADCAVSSLRATPTTTAGALGRQGAYDAPMSTPTLAYGADFICRHCGAQYVVSYTYLPIADSGSAYCDVCRRQMIQWNSSAEPSYRLVKRPDQK
jgi:hypothetical protein